MLPVFPLICDLSICVVMSLKERKCGIFMKSKFYFPACLETLATLKPAGTFAVSS